MTHTYAILEILPESFQEIKGRLKTASYEHTFSEDSEHGLIIDMHGIALAELKKKDTDQTSLADCIAWIKNSPHRPNCTYNTQSRRRCNCGHSKLIGSEKQFVGKPGSREERRKKK